jgi:hypothetical protein
MPLSTSKPLLEMCRLSRADCVVAEDDVGGGEVGLWNQVLGEIVFPVLSVYISEMLTS